MVFVELLHDQLNVFTCGLKTSFDSFDRVASLTFVGEGACLNLGVMVHYWEFYKSIILEYNKNLFLHNLDSDKLSLGITEYIKNYFECFIISYLKVFNGKTYQGILLELLKILLQLLAYHQIIIRIIDRLNTLLKLHWQEQSTLNCALNKHSKLNFIFNRMENIKIQEINENTNSLWRSLSTFSDKEHDSLEINTISIAKRAIINLQEHSISRKPICRQKQAKQIEEFVERGVKMGGSSQTLYIAGMPGIGKTLTVTSVIDHLKETSSFRKQFKSYYLNAMAYKHPSKIYKSLLYRLFKIKGVSNSKEIARLDYLFTTSSETKTKVIILDELDYLMTKDQSVLYNLFQWAQNPNSKLVFIAISNTIDLPELLKQKTYSRMGDHKIAFKSYDKDQIYQIVIQRLQSVQIFDKETLRYACTKLSTFSCDIRKVLFLLRKSLTIFIQKSNSERVQIEHVQLAFNQTFRNKPECKYIKSMSKDAQMVLIQFALANQCSLRKGQCSLSIVALKIHKSCPHISFSAIQRIATNLKEAGILDFESQVNNHTMDTVVHLRISPSDIKAAIDHEDFDQLLEVLQN